MSSLKDDTKKAAGRLSREAAMRARAAQEVGITNPVRALSEAGFRSEWAYLGGFLSIGLSLTSWLLSRAKRDERAQDLRPAAHVLAGTCERSSDTTVSASWIGSSGWGTAASARDHVASQASWGRPVRTTIGGHW